MLAVRTARNRRLYDLPERPAGPGRPPSYGALAPHPGEWLHRGLTWQNREVPVRGRTIVMKFQVLGPFVREGSARTPALLDRRERDAPPSRQTQAPLASPQARLLFGLRAAGSGNLAVAPADRNAAGLAVATLGTRSGASRNEKRLRRGRKTMLESPRHHRLGAVECVGLCPPVVSGLSHLGLTEWTTHSHPLVVWCTTLVVQYPLASIPLGVLGNAPISSPLDANPGQLAQKGSLPAGLVQCRERVGSHLTQTGHSRTLFGLPRFTFNFAQKAKVEGFCLRPTSQPSDKSRAQPPSPARSRVP